MRAATVLLLTSDQAMAATVRAAIGNTVGCEMDWCTDVVRVLERSRRYGSVGLVIVHVRTAVDAAQAGCLLKELTRQPRPVPGIVLCEEDVPKMRLKLLRDGAIDCLTRPIDVARLTFLIDILSVRARYQPQEEAKSDPALDENVGYRHQSPAGEYLFRSPSSSRLYDQVRAIASRDTTVLILGEPGTGKTHLARVIHELSPRSHKPFMVVHCGALTPTVLESEMFGHVRGAFAHADQDRVGKLAEAADGTLLLDEVDCIPLDCQVKLLRAMEERVFEPVGSNKSHALRARIIAAANRSLDKDVAVGRFRSDLYYRLNVASFCLPPLRERRELIRPLVHKFLGELAESSDTGEAVGISEEAMGVLETHHWPGNIRELRNIVERAVTLCPGQIVELDSLPETFSRGPLVVAEEGGSRSDHLRIAATGNELADARMTAEFQRLREALMRNNNNRTGAAADLGISRVTLYKKLRRYGLA